MKPRTYLTSMMRLALVAALVLACGFRFPVQTPEVSLSHPATAALPSAISALRLGTAEPDGRCASLVVSNLKQPEGENFGTTEQRAWEVASANRTYWLSVVMALIAVLQLGLFAVQLSMMRRNITDTANAAKAAELSAKAAIGIELPFLKVVPTDLLGADAPVPDDGPYGGYVNDGPPVAYNVLGSIEISNLGRTPAYSLSVSIGWLVTDALPEAPPPYRLTKRMSHNMVLVGGTETRFDSDAYIALSSEEVSAAAQNEKWLWIFGKVEYRDFMDQLQSAGFCWRFANRNPPGDHPLYYLSSDGEPPAVYTRRTAVINT